MQREIEVLEGRGSHVAGERVERVVSLGRALADSIRGRLRNVLLVQTRVDLVPWGSLRRSEYKSKLVER